MGKKKKAVARRGQTININVEVPQQNQQAQVNPVPAPQTTQQAPRQNTTKQKHELAPISLRLAAKAIDLGILLLFTYLFALVARLTATSGIAGVIYLIIIFLYPVYFIGMQGATPGKKMLGIKVIRKDGSDCTYLTALIREIGEIICTLILLLGYALILIDKDKQGVHDKIAKTIVVKE